MKIVYFSYALIPSKTANSIHIMKMCNAFAQNGHEVVLIYPDSFGLEISGIEDVFEFYGVQNNFKTEKMFLFPKTFSHLVNYCAKWKIFLFGLLGLKRIFYPLVALIYIKVYKPDLIYSVAS